MRSPFRIVLCGLWMLVLQATLSAQVVINELRIDEPGDDFDEYFELAGPPGTSLDGLTYLVIGDSSAGSGVIENVTDLSGMTIPASGYFLVAEASLTLLVAPAVPDFVTTLNFENSDNVTHLLVEGFTGLSGDDLDTDDDGVLDATPWTTIVDLIALCEETATPPTGTEWHYGPPAIGPTAPLAPGGPVYVPSHISRCPDTTGDFLLQDHGLIGEDSPGVANICPTCLPPVSFLAVSDCAADEVVLTWDLADSYVDIDISRNGAGIASLLGTETTYTDVSPGAGSLEYTLTVNCAAGQSTVTFQVIHAPYSGQQNAIFVGEHNQADIDSVAALQAAMNDIGEDYILIDQLDSVCIDTFAQAGNRIWLMLGTYPDNYHLDGDDGTALVALVQAGVHVYIESADTFVYDPLTPFSDYDGVDNAINGLIDPLDGDDSFTEMNGLVHSILDLTSYQQVVYNQDSTGEDYTDQIVPSGTTPGEEDVAGSDVGLIWVNSPDLLPDPTVSETAYGTGVYYITDGALGNVISVTWEFGGFGDDQASLLSQYITALDNTMIPTGDEFRRGDSNGDTSFDISDAVFSLAALFTPGSPLPPAPHPDCGVDPTTDTLTCISSSCP